MPGSGLGTSHVRCKTRPRPRPMDLIAIPRSMAACVQPIYWNDLLELISKWAWSKGPRPPFHVLIGGNHSIKGAAGSIVSAYIMGT
jgi:hypothetical protein